MTTARKNKMVSEKMYFEFLDGLRESGLSVPDVGRPYLMAQFALAPNRAVGIIQRWAQQRAAHHG